MSPNVSGLFRQAWAGRAGPGGQALPGGWPQRNARNSVVSAVIWQEERSMRALTIPNLTAAMLVVGMALAGAQQAENLAGPQQKGDQEKAQHTEPGRAGTTEPSSHTPTPKPEETAVFVNGRLAAPGAPADSQTVPAKFSERNAALDKLPTMAFPLQLTDEQKQRIRNAVGKAPVATAKAGLADVLPRAVEIQKLPGQVANEIPAVRNLGFVRTADGILLVKSLDRIVVEEVPGPAK
jgi:hypothetical protein